VKKRGIINAALSGALARLGHTHSVVVADCGLPRPAGVPWVDLAVVFGVPTFAQVIDALADELAVEQFTVARETKESNPSALALLTDRFGPPRWVTHAELKGECAAAQLFVRTGEATPFANTILRCGVPF
jgi:D-ribose pyranase